jgi:nitrate/nitrite transporter NarK
VTKQEARRVVAYSCYCGMGCGAVLAAIGEHGVAMLGVAMIIAGAIGTAGALFFPRLWEDKDDAWRP